MSRHWSQKPRGLAAALAQSGGTGRPGAGRGHPPAEVRVPGPGHGRAVTALRVCSTPCGRPGRVVVSSPPQLLFWWDGRGERAPQEARALQPGGVQPRPVRIQGGYQPSRQPRARLRLAPAKLGAHAGEPPSSPGERGGRRPGGGGRRARESGLAPGGDGRLPPPWVPSASRRAGTAPRGFQHLVLLTKIGFSESLPRPLHSR